MRKMEMKITMKFIQLNYYSQIGYEFVVMVNGF